MANKRICIQIDFNGPSPLITRSGGAVDKRLSLVNLARLIRGVDKGAQFRVPPTATTVVVQDTLVQASATATCAAVAVNDTVTLGGQALTAKQLRASGTATAATVLAGTTLTINGQVFTGVAGAAVLGEATFSVDTGDNAVAASIAAQVNAYGGAKIKGVIKAKAAAAVVTIYAVMLGTVGNGYALASSDGATLAVSAAALANGVAVANNWFDCIGSNDETAADLARCVTVSTTAAIKQVTAAAAAAVCTFTAIPPGKAGNTITLVSSNGSRLAVTGSGFLASGSAGAPTAWTF